MKKIPNELLWQACAEAAVPVKKLTAQSVDVWRAVADLKAALQNRHGEKEAFKRLQTVMGDAFADGAHKVLEEVAKAQEKSMVRTTRAWSIRQEGREEIEITRGTLTNAPRARVTLAIAQAILQLQDSTERAPTRREILDVAGKSLENGLDETELSSQLTKLGWNDMLS
jgi:hypothetical protein